MAGSAPVDEGNYHQAAGKLSRYLTDPRTPDGLRLKLGAALVELASLTNTHVDHPALCGRAMVLMCDGLPDESTPGSPAVRAAEHLIDLIDALPEMPGGGE